jgi:hypothetical protein
MALSSAVARAPRPIRIAAAAALAALPPAVYAVALLARRPWLFDGGDQVLLEWDLLRASQLHQFVGAYSQFGFAHPGPSWFYLLAPLYRLFGTSEAAAVAAAAVLHALTLAATVGLAGRWRGTWAALGTAALLAVYLRAVAVPAVTYLWNPFAVMLPVILFVLLAAGAAAGSRRAGWLAAVAGGFLVQTDLATAPFVLCAAFLTVVRRGLREGWRRALWTRRSGRRDPVVVAAVVALALEWAPPLTQELLRPRGNLSGIVSTLSNGTATHSAAAALAAQGQAAAVFPFGSLSVRQAATSLGTAEILALAVWIAGATGLWRLGRRWDDGLARECGLLSLAAVPVAFTAACMVRGKLDAYQLFWITGLPVAMLIGWVLLAARPSPPDAPRRSGRPVSALIAVCVAAGVLSALFTTRQLLDSTSRHHSGGNRLALASAFVDRHLGSPPADGRGVEVVNETGFATDTTLTLGLMLELAKRGWTPVAEPRVAAFYDLPAASRPADHTLLMTLPGRRLPAGFRLLGPISAAPGAPVIAVDWS